MIWWEAFVVSRYKYDALRVENVALKTRVDILAAEYCRLLKRAAAAEAARPGAGVTLSSDDINRLIMLCHPDRHQGKRVKTADEMTKKLLLLRGK